LCGTSFFRDPFISPPSCEESSAPLNRAALPLGQDMGTVVVPGQQ